MEWLDAALCNALHEAAEHRPTPTAGAPTMNNDEPMRTPMLRRLAMLLPALLCLGAQAATYVYTGSPYSGGTINNATSCAAPEVCGQFTVGQSVSGSITTALPLAPNLTNSDIAASVTGYSFSNGVSSIVSGSPPARLVTALVTTDGAGAITSADIKLQRWTYSAAGSAAAGPHVAGDRFDEINVVGAVASGASINGFCAGVDISVPTDTCNTVSANTATSVAVVSGGAWDMLPSVSIADASVLEGNSGFSNLNFPITLSAIPSAPVTVTVGLTGGTATAGTDFAMPFLSVSWAPGDPVTKNFVIVVQGESIAEPDETLQLTLSNPVGAVLGAAVATGTILNDDAVPPAAATAIPTLSEWTLMLLATASVVIGMWRTRRP